MASLARAESGRTAEERANVPEQSLLTLCKRERERERGRESKQGGLSIDGRAGGLPDYLKYYVASSSPPPSGRPKLRFKTSPRATVSLYSFDLSGKREKAEQKSPQSALTHRAPSRNKALRRRRRPMEDLYEERVRGDT